MAAHVFVGLAKEIANDNRSVKASKVQAQMDEKQCNDNFITGLSIIVCQK